MHWVVLTQFWVKYGQTQPEKEKKVSKRRENRGQRDRERSKMKGCQKKGGNYWPFLMEMLMK